MIKKYRIKSITNVNGVTIYFPQERCLFFWNYIYPTDKNSFWANKPEQFLKEAMAEAHIKEYHATLVKKKNKPITAIVKNLEFEI